MAQAKVGDKVKVHYTGTLADGSEFDSSVDRKPLQFTLGGGQMIAGFDQAVQGMAPGDTKIINLAPDQAYGPQRDDMILVVNRDQFPPNITPKVGQQLELQQTNGKPASVVVTEVSDTKVSLDANHPLSGKDLTFEILLVEIV